MSVTVKICGITSPVDAQEAADAGADAVGLMFYEGSPRCVSLEVAKAIVKVLPPSVARVGVFVNAEESLVRQAMRECTLNVLQFHGEESPEFCAGFGAMTLKAIRVKDESSLAELERFGTDGFLLDAFSKDARGGTGEQFNWKLARKATECGKPIFLAGGLTAENVTEAVRVAEPFAVDVSSGVEIEPGRKDAEKMRMFVAAAKGT
tara:strand:- start:167 stop:784 length:618 start_codon:yes stop_codon:yes gene_type:complete